MEVPVDGLLDAAAPGVEKDEGQGDEEDGECGVEGLEGGAEKEIKSAYQTVSDNNANNIIFNFRENDYINSAGIAILIGIVTEARKRNQRLLMAMPSSHFQKIFRMVGLTQYADIYSSLEEAQASVN